MKMIGRYIAVWPLLFCIGFINGAIREFLYNRWLGELTAHQVSSLTLAVLFGVCVWVLMERWPLESTAQAAAVGLIWMVMTAGFEFGFFHYAMGYGWERLLHDYNVMAGRAWPLVLVWIAASPSVFYCWKNRLCPKT